MPTLSGITDRPLVELVEPGSLVYVRRCHETWSGGAVLGQRPTIVYHPDRSTMRRGGEDCAGARDYTSGPPSLAASVDPGEVEIEIDADQARPLVIPYRGSLRIKSSAAGTWEYKVDVRRLGEATQARDRVYSLTRPVTASPHVPVIPAGAVGFEFHAAAGTSVFADFTIGGATLGLSAAVGQFLPLLNCSALTLRIGANGVIRWHVELG